MALTAVARLLGALRLTRYIWGVVPGIAEVAARRTKEWPLAVQACERRRHRCDALKRLVTKKNISTAF